MKRAQTLAWIVSLIALSACMPSNDENDHVVGQESVDSNLECAALISAANALIVSGQAENDADLSRRALVVSMTYLNTYAIPKKLKQAEAFSEVKSRRAILMESRSPDKIMSRAKRCMNRAP